MFIQNAITIETCVTLSKQQANVRHLPKVSTGHNPHWSHFRGDGKGELGRPTSIPQKHNVL